MKNIYEFHNRLTARGAEWTRASRKGRPDGTSVRGRYIVRWQDEDEGWKALGVTADGPQAAIQAVAHLVNSTATAYRV